MSKTIRRIIRRTVWRIWLPLSLLYSEIVLKLWCFKEAGGKPLFFTALITVCIGLAFTWLCSLQSARRFHRWIAILQGLAAVLYCTQAVYYCVFKAFLLLSYMGEAGMVLGSFWREALVGIWRTLPIILLLFVPFTLWLIFGLRFCPRRYPRRARLKYLAFTAALILCAGVIIGASSNGIRSISYLYYDNFVPEMSMRYFGALTVLKQDLIHNLGLDEIEISEKDKAALAATEELEAREAAELAALAAGISLEPEPEPEVIDYGPNMLDLDFEAALAGSPNDAVRSVNNYVATVTPTSKNEYTGLFEGYNLIWICAEGLCGYAIDETHTPTLYRMASEGFVFENFYNPYWYFSTADGEYTFLNGLLPISGDKSVYTAMYNYLPYGMGNLMRLRGYCSYGFHGHTSIYYSRDVSMPNLGYEFHAKDTGLDISNNWPESDVEMFSSSLPYYIDKAPFNVYYMTISGHMNYTFEGNNMSRKHRDQVEDMDASDTVKAYIACQIELDDGLQLLLDELEAAGQLDRTVIVISGDHYPYDLDPYFTSDATGLAELMGTDTVDNLEKFHSKLILWNAAFARENTVKVDELCCQIDVLPTLMNLFNIEYDSRLLIGRDIFGDEERTVVFRDHSYITNYGRYDASTDTFTPNPGAFASDADADAYAAAELKTVDNYFTVSKNILNNNYYYWLFISQ